MTAYITASARSYEILYRMLPMCNAQAITFRTESDMVAAARKLPVGALAFTLSDELLFLRVQRGLREIQVTTFP